MRGEGDGDVHILVTGGAGFIGVHLANRLVADGYRVRVLDRLEPQVHGEACWPVHLSAQVERCLGDIRDREAVRRALLGITHVYHFAAAVGVGQSMYEIEHYTDVNNRGTAVLLEELARRHVSRLIVASSMSVYGEGMYRSDAVLCEPQARSRDQLIGGEWQVYQGGEVLEPVPTPETKRPAPTSVYALSKFDQEQLCLLLGAAYRVETLALRFFNVYGPYQALSNPYTGVLAIFAARILNGNAPLIFEDGLQQRDFVTVWDVVEACRLALTARATGEIFNIGSGEPRSVRSVADSMIRVLGASTEPVITGKYRVGDVRHCFADIAKARRLLGYEPHVTFEEGLLELAEWLSRMSAPDNFTHAALELKRRGLTI